MSKQFFYKVFNSSGSFIATWNDASEPRFSWDMNGGLSDMDLELARKITDFSEDNEVKVFNEVQCWINDNETPFDAKKIYSGWIADYRPTISARKESVNITLLPYTTELSDNLWIGSGSSTFSFRNTDPKDMIINSLENKTRTVDGKIGSQSNLSTYILPVGRELSYTFKGQTYRDVLDKAVELSPGGAYWFVDADNNVHFRNRSESVLHVFRVGKDVVDMEVKKDVTKLANVAVGLFGVPDGNTDPLYVSFGSESGGYDGSKVEYGKRTKFFTDERITELSTANYIMGSYLEYYNAPLVSAKITVADNNGTSVGYDIESIQPGDTVQIRNPFRDEQLVELDDYSLDNTPLDASIDNLELLPMQVTSIKYELGEATLTLSNDPLRVQNEIYDLERIQRAHITRNVPDGIQVT